MGRRCAEAGRDVIGKIVHGADLVFVTAGLGGGRHWNRTNSRRGGEESGRSRRGGCDYTIHCREETEDATSSRGS